MPEDRSVSGSLSSPRSLQSTSIAGQSEISAKQKAGSKVNRMSDKEIVKESSLLHVLDNWWIRAGAGGAQQHFVELSNLAMKYQLGQGKTVHTEDGDIQLDNNQVGQLLKHRAGELVEKAQRHLANTDEYSDKVAASLLRKYVDVVSTLQRYAENNSAASSDIEKRRRGFTNLRLFVRYGGKLHSTSRGDKLDRTIAKIPPKVLNKASGDVTFKDYAIAEHMKYENGKLPLLSFHGFKAKGSWFGKGKDSRAYRQNLRAITASAFLLGGLKKAVQVKQLLTSINAAPFVNDHSKREKMVERVLNNLARHGDLDALIDDLNFELERHKVLKTVRDGIGDPKDDIYIDIRNNLQRLDNVSNRNTITTNLMNCITYRENRSTPFYEDRYDSNNLATLQADLELITHENPVGYHLNENPGNAKAAQYAILAWAELMTQSGSNERNNLEYQLEKIEIQQSKEEQEQTFADAAHWFRLVDKSKLSPQRQSVLLLSCLSNPDKDDKWHLANMDRQKGSVADLDLNDDLGFEIDGIADRDSVFSDKQQETKADIDDDSDNYGNYGNDDIDDDWEDDDIPDEFYDSDVSSDPENADD